jgi:hypothetical protein
MFSQLNTRASKSVQFNTPEYDHDAAIKLTFRGEPNPLPLPVEFRHTTINVGDPLTQREMVHSPAACKTLLSAADKLRRGRIYLHVEPGLHLRYTLAELKKLPYVENIGVLSQEYQLKGEKDVFAPFVPAEGMVRLSKHFGILSARPVVFVEFDESHPEKFNQKDYNSFKLHSMMDALLSGNAYHLDPNFRKDVKEVPDDDPKKTFVERKLAFVAKWESIWNMSDEEAEISYREMVATKQVFQALGKTAAALKQAEVDGVIIPAIDTLPLKDGGVATLEDLNGKTIRRWYGIARIGGTIVVTPENWGRESQVILDRNLTVQVIQ